jgi:FkbM family methyltransferase
MKIYKDLKFNNREYRVCIDSDDPSGEGCINEIFYHNEYVLDQFVNLKSHIIDIGANCGMATIILAKQNPESIIYSFEPHYPTFLLLKENVELNNLTNVKMLNMAVSDSSNKKLVLFNHPDFSGGNTTCSTREAFSSHFRRSVNTTEIDCISLDDIINLNNIENVHLLKIDCEGAEYEILRNSQHFINKRIKNLVGEFHNLRYNVNAENNNQKLLEYCNQFVDGIKKVTMLTI